MSGEFAYLDTRGHGYFVLDAIAGLHINGDDDQGTSHQVTPLFGEMLQVIAGMAREIAYAEAGDSDEKAACKDILEDMPKLKDTLARLEAHCKFTLLPDNEP